LINEIEQQTTKERKEEREIGWEREKRRGGD